MRTLIILLGTLSAVASAEVFTNPSHGFSAKIEDDRISVTGGAVDFSIKTKGYVTGIAAQSFLDKQTGFRDPGYGLVVIDWLLEPGSDAAWREALVGDLAELRYDTGNHFHGDRPKRSIEGPQICTGAHEISPEFSEGDDFVAVTQSYAYKIAAPGKNRGSQWTQTIVFPKGKRWFLAADVFKVNNDSEAMLYRMDLPGHIIHDKGDTFSEVYLSYHGRIPAEEFTRGNFSPESKFFYRRDAGKVPERMIRAYRLRDPKTGEAGPWLAGMTLDPALVSEAWCHQRDYVCFIQENGERPIKAGESFGAAYIVGYFDSIEEMERTYDQYRGASAIQLTKDKWSWSSRK